MDDDYTTQDTSTYIDGYQSNSFKNIQLNYTYEIDRSNNLTFTRDKDYSSSERINEQTNIFSCNDNDEASGDNIKHHPSGSQRSIVDETDKHLACENYDFENSNIQNDEYLLNINQDNINKDDHENEDSDSGCCTSNDSMTCLDVCCTCFCL